MHLNELNILVTGGAGFIGSNIVQYLLEHDVKYVRILDNLSTGHKKNIEQLLIDYPDRLQFVWGDMTNLETCRQAVANINVVCHQGALGSVPRSVDDPLTSHNSNVNGFVNILIACLENNVKRIVYASSSSVYGENADLPKVEYKIGRQISPYAVNKYVDELYAGVFNKCYGLETIGLRYFNVFGPRQDPNGAYTAVIPKFISKLLNNEQPTINGDGSFSRDFTYIDNVIQANVLSMTTTNSECFGNVFNIGNECQITINDIFNTIKTILKKDIQPLYGPIRKGDVPHSFASIERAKCMLGYQPTITFNEGILKTINYYNNDLL